MSSRFSINSKDVLILRYKDEFVFSFLISIICTQCITIVSSFIMIDNIFYITDMTKDDSSNPLIIIGIICGCLGCTFLALAGYFIWRKCIKNPPTGIYKHL